jgi:hypothetical protein
MSKQTAVEWLIEKMHKNIEWIPIPMQEQAKEMEKEQIMQAYNDGKFAIINIEKNKSLEQYYNETYKKEEK